MKKATIVTQLILTEPVMAIFRAIFPFNKLLNKQRLRMCANRQQLCLKLAGNVDLHPLRYFTLRNGRTLSYMSRDFWIVNWPEEVMPLRNDSSLLLSFGTTRKGAGNTLLVVLRLLNTALADFFLVNGRLMTVFMSKRIPQLLKKTIRSLVQ